MSAVTTKTEYTPEDLLAMPDGERYELVNGVLVERHMGLLSEWIAGRLHYHLTAFCESHPSGWVFTGGDAGYQGFPGSPRTVRKPDVSFVRYCWKRAHREAWKMPPREVVLRRLERAKALGMSYREYTAIILDRGVHL